MNYSIQCSESENHVRIFVDGTWPADNPEKIIIEMYDFWAKHQKPYLLIDIRNMEDKPSVLSDYEDAERFAKNRFYLVRRVAVLDNQNRKESNDFFETTAANRGLRIKFFYTAESDAINWLISGESAG